MFACFCWVLVLVLSTFFVLILFLFLIYFDLFGIRIDLSFAIFTTLDLWKKSITWIVFYLEFLRRTQDSLNTEYNKILYSQYVDLGLIFNRYRFISKILTQQTLRKYFPLKCRTLFLWISRPYLGAFNFSSGISKVQNFMNIKACLPHRF